MPLALPPEAVGFLILLTLALLPGVLIVRAPWPAVPALSVAFWTLSWWWVPLEGRDRLLRYALLAFVVLAVLRVLPRHSVPPPPGYAGPEPPPPVTGPTTGHAPRLRSLPSLVVGGVAVGLLVPLPLWRHVPGREMAFHTAAARLAVWRDALPATHEPLLPLPHFGAHAPGLSTLAADVSLLSGLAPGRSMVLAALLTAGLLLIGLYAFLGTRLRAAAAALAALLGLAAAPWPDFLAVWGEGGPVLALGLGLPAAALLIGHSSRPSSSAAGMLLGAALLAQPLLTVALGLGIVVWAAGPSRDGRSAPFGTVSGRGADVAGRSLGRVTLAFGVAAVFAGPALVRLGRAFSLTEAVGVLKAIEGRELMSFATGLALLGLATLLALLLAPARPRSRVLTGGLVAASAVMLLISAHLGPARGQLDPPTLRALESLEGEGRPLEAVCATDGVILDWVPALAGRAPGGVGREVPQPWIPHSLRDEWGRAARRDCSRTLDPSAPGAVTSFDVRPGTPVAGLRISH